MELYMGCSELRNRAAMVQEDKRDGVKADYDRLEATVQGFTIAVKVRSRVPYTRIELEDDNAPFHFSIALNFNPQGEKTDFSIEVEAELNFMMKMMLGNKIQEGLDKAVDALVAVSEGRMPEGIDPSMFN